MARIVSLDLQLVIHLSAAQKKQAYGPVNRNQRLLRTRRGEIQHLNSLVEVQRHHFLHAVLDHLRGEEVGLPLLVDRDLAEVFQQNGADGLGGMGHVNWPIVAHHLAHEGQSATVVQVEMAEGAKVWLFKTLSSLVVIHRHRLNTDLMMTQSRKSVRRPFWVI